MNHLSRTLVTLLWALLVCASPCWAEAPRASGGDAGKTSGESAGKGPGASSAGADKGKTGSGEQAPKVKVERGRGGRKVFRITTSWVIEGRIQKPNAFYVLQRSQINYDWAKMKQNFLPKITGSVTAAPF